MGRSQKPLPVDAYKEELRAAIAESVRRGKLEPSCDNDSEASLCRRYVNTCAGLGKAVYESFSDDELAELLLEKTKELGYASPQKEIHYIYRIYIKKRFDNWPRALELAGLSKLAGKGGDSYDDIRSRREMQGELLESVARKAGELGRTPHMQEMPECAKGLSDRFETWAQVLDAAGVDINFKKAEALLKIEGFSEEEKELLGGIHALALELGRAPLRTEVKPEVYEKLKKPCGTWRNILFQLDLSPVEKINPFSMTFLDGRRISKLKHKDILEDSLFEIINPDEETAAMLAVIAAKAEKLGRAPVREELPKRVYAHLVSLCGSYRNILYQAGLKPVDKKTEYELVQKIRMKKRRAGKLNRQKQSSEKRESVENDLQKNKKSTGKCIDERNEC